MGDLANLSTEELMRMRAVSPPAADLSKMSTEDLMRLKGKVTREPDAIEKSALENMKPTRFERFGRGVADVTQGVKQLYLDAKDVVTGGNEAAPYTADKTAELATYEKGRGPDAGVDWMRLGGNVAATAPAMLIPGGGAATIAPRIASGVAQGAVSSASMFTPEGQSKLEQTLIGAGIGGAMPVVFRAGQQAISNLVGKFVPERGVDLSQLQGELSFQLGKQGIKWKDLTGEVQQSLLADAKKTLETGGLMDPTQLARKADIEAIGAKGTQAAVTRAPKDWQTQQNLRGITGAGEAIAERNQGDAKAMVDYLSQLRARTGGKAATPLEAGESTVTALQKQDATLKQGVDEAYGVARDHLGRAAPMDSAGFSKAANLALDDQMLGHYLPTEVRSILNDVTVGKIPFNVNTAVQIDSTLSAAQRSAGKGSPQALAIGKVRDALNSAGIADNVGVEAKAAFDTARGAAKSRFALHEDVPAMGAAIDEVGPDHFVKKFILGADAGTLKTTLNQLRSTAEGAQAISDIKGTLLDSLLLKSTGATNIDDVAGRAFSGRNFAKAIDSIPPEKLHTLFSPSEVEALRTLQRASKYLTEEVPFSDVNHSKTTAALANLLQKIGSTPMLGQMLSPIIGAGKIGMDWVKNATDRKAVAEMLVTSAGAPGPSAALRLPPPNALAQAAPAVAAGVSQRLDDKK